MVTLTGSLNNRVLAALQTDPRTKDALIDVASMAGMVTLTGTVKSQKIRQAAEEITRNQPGVLSVIDEIKVGG